MKTIDYSYFIERYNAGEMSETEKQWFEKELEGNEKLRKEVSLRKHTDEVLKGQNILTLRAKLAAIERQRTATVPIKKSKNNVVLKYAAVIAVLVIFGSITMFSGKNLSNEKILTQYYKSYQAPAFQRSGLNEVNSDFVLALEYYNTHDFKNAAILFNKVVSANPKDMQSVLLNGVSNFEDSKYPEAKQSFKTVINDNNNLFIETAEWYLALCYVKTDENSKAIDQLKKIKSEGGIYSKDAGKIIRKLK